MTVAELMDKLRAIPQDLTVLIPDNWDEYPYTFVQGIMGLRPVTCDSPEGGTFNWGWDQHENKERGLSYEGVCIYPEE
jgi:hypothetical protein